MLMRRGLTGFWLVIVMVAAVPVSCLAASGAALPVAPQLVLTDAGPDTVRTNLVVAEAVLADAMTVITDALPREPIAVVLVPGSKTPAANLLTTVATHRLLAAGHQVHVDRLPPGTEGRAYELRYRVDQLDLAYPDRGRRFLFWNSWVDRQLDAVVELTLVDHRDKQVLASERIVRRYQDRVEADHLAALESPVYPFTVAEQEGGGWTRRLEEIVVLGTLAGLVAIYFANTE